MDPNHRRILRDNLNIFVEETKSNINNIVNEFRNSLVINDYMVNKINRHESDEEKSKELWLLLPKRGPQVFHKILDVLMSTGNGGKIKFLMRPNRKDYGQILETNLETNETNGFVMAPEQYEMTTTPRGYVLIINVYSYLREPEKTREGSEIDVENLKALYERLGHVVDIINQASSETLPQAFERFVSTKRPRVHCCTIFVMSHGRSGRKDPESVNIDLSDGKTWPNIWFFERLRASEAPIFAGVPKVLFFVTCRGDVPDNEVTVNTQNDFHSKITQEPQTDGTVRNLPLLSDLLVVYATSQGRASYRDERGAWLVQELVDVLKRDAAHFDMLTMLETVDRQVRSRGSKQRKLQISNVTKIGFNKKLYLNPPPTFFSNEAATNGNT